MTLQSAARPSIRGSLSEKDRQRWQKTYYGKLYTIVLHTDIIYSVSWPYNLQPDPVLEEAYRRKTGKDDKKLTTVNYIYSCTTYRYTVYHDLTICSQTQY